MAFEKEIRTYINEYCQRDLPNDEWYENEFNFIKNDVLRKRIIIEFKNVRKIYKIFEGLVAEDELLLAEVRLQVLMYASIYETIIHYLLFDEYYKEDQRVKDLLNQIVCKQYAIPLSKMETLKKELEHDGKEIIPYFRTTQKRDITKIRFDEKCKVAESIGLIKEFKLKDKKTNINEETGEIIEIESADFCSELIKIYEIRNSIHIHAEVKKEIQYHLDLSILAYKRMRPFVDQIKAKLQEDEKFNTYKIIK